MKRYATIVASGRYIPDIECSNEIFRKRFGDEAIQKLEDSTGILTRYYAPQNYCCSDIATKAIQNLLGKCALPPEKVDLLILGTDSPDFITPCTSVVVQKKAGLVNAGTFDVGCACASFPTGLAIASGIIATQPQIKNIIVVGSYMMHKLADVEKDINSFFYGDGAGAVLVTASEEPGFVSSTIKADGSYAMNWGIYSGGTYEPATVESVQAGRTQVRFVTPFPATVNNEGWPMRIKEVAENGGFEVKDIDHIVFTQVRSRTIDKVMETVGLPIEKAHKVMQKWGYLGSSCLPVAFDEALELKKIKAGDLVVFVGSGVGYNQCSVAFRMPKSI
ncbi:MAG: ketoacyl-ACP synthase III [Candidatus Riflebacteria bacterium]|nr:ketoacyl-ACP synthase III [Candidatus Riflebacteria bacterium]